MHRARVLPFRQVRNVAFQLGLKQTQTQRRSITMKPAELRRHQQRGQYDLASVSAVFDDTFMAHVSYVDNGLPQCLPMIALFHTVGDNTAVYLHGHPSARLMELVRQNKTEDGSEKDEKIKVCVTATKGQFLLSSLNRVEGSC